MVYIILSGTIRLALVEVVEARGTAAAEGGVKLWTCRRSAYSDIEVYFDGASWGLGLGWGRVQKLFFSEDQRVDVISGQLEAVTVSDCVGGTRFVAVAAENTTRVVDIVHAGVTLPC